MAHDYTGLFRDLAAHPLTIDNSFRARFAVQGRAVPLRDHEILAMALPKGIGAVKGVSVGPSGCICVRTDSNFYSYDHPLFPPEVRSALDPEEKSLLEKTRDALENGDLVADVRIIRDKAGERVNLLGHRPFAEIQRDTVRVVGGKLRYVGWAESFQGKLERVREKPALIVDGVATPIEYGDSPKILADRDDLYALTVEATRVGDPKPPGMFDHGWDGKRRDTRVRSLDGSVDILAENSVSDDWNFIARSEKTIILTGARRFKDPDRCSTIAVLRADGRGHLIDPLLVGNGRRLPNGVLVECLLNDNAPGFAWFRDDETMKLGCKKFPLYGDLKNVTQADERTLRAWHVEGDTLFLSRYSRD